MLLITIKSRVRSLPTSVVRCNKRKYSVPAVNQHEKSELQYPPIVDLSAKAKIYRKNDDYTNAILKARTVEEKMIKINMPRYYGWRSVMLEEGIIPYNSIELMQYLTRTHIVKEPGLPSYYNSIITPEKLQAIVGDIKESVEEGLVFEYTNRNRSQEIDEVTKKCPKEMDNIMSKAITKQIHRTLTTHMAMDKPYLLDTEVDYDPRVEAFWFAGGLPTPAVIKRRQDCKFLYLPERLDPGIDRAIQYVGKPNLNLRHSLPLSEIIPLSESENPDYVVPEFKYEPRTLGLVLGRRHGTNIPGFWPGDKSEFGCLSYHNCGYLTTRKKSYNDTSEALKVQTVLGSWGWLLSQACNQGFSTFNDVTYPLTNQMILTNGKWWTFGVYQLNTTLVHSHHIDENPRRNVCWITEPMQLFEKIEDNKVHGLNNAVLENIVKFYANEPREREGVELKPYLNETLRHVAQIWGPNRRAWLEETFKRIASNRPRHRRIPEVFAWQEIYQRKNKTRPLDKKREPWEFGIDVWHRRLDDHARKYVPKALRKNIKLKFAPNFYP